MKGVSHGGKEDKVYAISPHNYSDTCFVCTKPIAEAQPFRLNDKVAGQRRHANCLESQDGND